MQLTPPRNWRNVQQGLSTVGMKRKYHHNTHYGISPAQSRAYVKTMKRPRVVAIPHRRFNLPYTLPASQPLAKHISGSEVKAVDSGLIGTNVPAVGTVYALNLVQEGSSFYNRIGRRIAMKSIEVKGYYSLVAGTAAAVVKPGLSRIMIVYDRQPNGSLPAVADILLDYDQSGNTSTTVESGLNLNNRDRFSVVLDQRKYLPQVTQSGTSNQLSSTGTVWPTDGSFQNNCGVMIQEYRKLKGMETHYKASSQPSVIGDIATGALLLVLIAGAANDSEWNINLDTRLRYWDD